MENKIAAYKKVPKEFHPRFEIVSCYLEHSGKILLLHRRDDKPEGGTWGLPAGKIDGREDRLEAVIREIKEETGCEVLPAQIEYIRKVYVKYPKYHFIFYMFRTELDKKPRVVINSHEHKAYKWISPNEALNMNLIGGLNSCIEKFYLKL